MKLLHTFLICLLLVTSLASAQQSQDDDSLIEIGAGAQMSNAAPAAFLIQITRSGLAINTTNENVFIVAAVNYEQTINGAFKYMDFRFTPAGAGFAMGSDQFKGWIAGQALNVSVQKDEANGLAHYARVSVIGFTGGIIYKPIEEIKILAQATVDFWSAVNERTLQTNGYSYKTGAGSGATAHVAASFFDRIIVDLGAEVDSFSPTKAVCDNTGDCALGSEFKPDEHHGLTSLYADLAFKVWKGLHVFGNVQSNTFTIIDKIRAENNSRENTLYFRVGVRYNIH